MARNLPVREDAVKAAEVRYLPALEAQSGQDYAGISGALMFVDRNKPGGGCFCGSNVSEGPPQNARVQCSRVARFSDPFEAIVIACRSPKG
jgi:hypothetical protein